MTQSVSLESNAAATPRLRRRASAWQVQRDVLFALIIREAYSRVGGQWIGAVWTLFEPLAHTLLMMLLYGMVMGRASPAGEYPVFLATGMIPFFLYQNLASRLADGIEANRGLFSYRQVKPMDVLLARAVIEAGMSLIVFTFTIGFLGWMGFHVMPSDPLAMIGVNLLLIAFGTGYGIVMAVLTHERPRLRSMVRMVNMPIYLASGVMFPVDLLPREALDVLLWNPLLHLVELSRHAFIPAYRPTDGVGAFYPAMFALVLLAWGLALYQSKRRILTSS
jgi:capsular polysaccharide transport system permease protein